MSIFNKKGKAQGAGKNLRTGIAKVATAVTSKATRVFKKQEPSDKTKRNWNPTPKRKDVRFMSDEEFEQYTKNMTDAQYWELQAQRGIYQSDEEINEDYEDED